MPTRRADVRQGDDQRLLQTAAKLNRSNLLSRDSWSCASGLGCAAWHRRSRPLLAADRRHFAPCCLQAGGGCSHGDASKIQVSRVDSRYRQASSRIRRLHLWAPPAQSAPAVRRLPACRLVFLGDQSVGKTSIITRFMYDKFDTTYQVGRAADGRAELHVAADGSSGTSPSGCPRSPS